MRLITRILTAAATVALVGVSLPAQTPMTNRLMREKLLHAERVLDSLMTGDHAMLQRESAALEAATRAPGWAVLRSERYTRHSETFRRAAEDLTDAAKLRDSDGAMRAYVSMTLACYSCHRYVSDSRIAR